MSRTPDQKALLTALGAGFAVSLAVSPLAGATENPFSAETFKAGTQVAAESGCGGSQGGCGAMADEGKDKKKEESK